MATAEEDKDKEEIKEISKLGLTNKPEPFSSIMGMIGDRISKPRDEQTGTYMGVASRATPSA